MNPEARAIAEVYLCQWAPRTDAYAGWIGGSWRAVRAPLTPEVIVEAFASGVPISAYTVDREGMTHVGAIDFDTDTGIGSAYRVARRLADEGATVYVEPSRRGAHLWWPFAEPLPARTVRRALRAGLYMAGVTADPKIELRPVSDAPPGPDGLGASLRMPTMPHPLTGIRYWLHDSEGRCLGESVKTMLQAMGDPTPRSRVEELAQYGPPVDRRDVSRGDRAPHPPHEEDGVTASEVLMERWGMPHVRIGKANRCPAHEDRHPSLSVLPDDRRVVCHSPDCILHNDGRGRGTYELRQLAPAK